MTGFVTYLIAISYEIKKIVILELLRRVFGRMAKSYTYRALLPEFELRCSACLR